ncbi:MAG: MATE family efflux transporter [Oscillospiraceae bacterium]|nr:MATE family efflux transporter [Oscillospiraceae bacterium]
MLTKARGKLSALIQRNLSGECFSFKSLTVIFLPLLVDQAMVAILNIINSSMVSSSGAEAVSAVNMVDSVNLFMVNFFIAVATGGTVVVAQYMGRYEPKKAGEAAAQAILSCTLCALTIGVLIIVFSEPILNLLFGQAEPKVMENARIYLTGCCISYPAFAVFQAVSGALRGMGDTRSSIMLSIGMNVLVVLFNLVFINGMGLSVLGVTFSLNIARAAAAVAAVVYLLHTKHELQIKPKYFLRFSKSMQKSIMLIGLPSASEQMFFHGGKIITQTFIVSLGTMSMTAYAISMSMTILFQVPGNALNLTIMTVVGQCMGAGNVKEAKKFMHSFIIASLVLSTLVALVMLPFTPLLYQMYSPPDGIAYETFMCLLISVVGVPILWSMAFITPSALRAAGDAKFTSVAAMLSMWIVRVMLGYLLGIVLGYGIIGVVAAMVLEWGVRAVIFTLRKRGTKWYQHKVID